VREAWALTGFAGLPYLFARQCGRTSTFLNGRPVRDRLLAGALRAAYADFLARDRHPDRGSSMSILSPNWWIINVHPAKAEVRFATPAWVRA